MAEQGRSIDETLNDADAQWAKKFERALEEQRRIIGGVAQQRTSDIDHATREHLEALRREVIDETTRVRDATTERLNQTRSLVTSETRRLEEQTAAARNEMRRVAAEETAAFDELARERVAELQDDLKGQTELLGEF